MLTEEGQAVFAEVQRLVLVVLFRERAVVPADRNVNELNMMSQSGNWHEGCSESDHV